MGQNQKRQRLLSRQTKESQKPVKERNDSISAENSAKGFFAGVRAVFVEGGVSSKRLQVWKSRMIDLGGEVYTFDLCNAKSSTCTHVLAANQSHLEKKLNLEVLKETSQLQCYLTYDWVEDCLKKGMLLPHDPYLLFDPQNMSGNLLDTLMPAKSLVSHTISIQESGTYCTILEGESHRSGCIDELVEHVEIQTNLDLQEKASNPTLLEESKVSDLYASPRQAKEEKTSNLDKGHESIFQDNIDTSLNLNAHISGPLMEMSHIYEDAFADEWRAFTYRKAVNKIEKLPFKLKDAEELRAIEGIGESIVDKIKEILSTGTLKKLQHLKADPKVQTIQLFGSVWGVGPKQAQRLYASGYRNVKDLLRDSSLTRMGQIGVTYFEDLTLRIPREEVAEVEKFVQAVAEDTCAGAKAMVTGSFRRGHATCGDIDVLITHSDGFSHVGLLLRLVRKLKTAGFILDGLNVNGQSLEGDQVNQKESQEEADTFMGICQLPHKPCRRLDMKVYPIAMYPFALVYFTGNDVLNRKIRYHARIKGYKLSDRGLFLSAGKGKKVRSSEISIPCATEEEVFHKLGLPCPAPHQRNW